MELYISETQKYYVFFCDISDIAPFLCNLPLFQIGFGTPLRVPLVRGVTVELCSRRASISQRSSLTPKRSCKVGDLFGKPVDGLSCFGGVFSL